MNFANGFGLHISDAGVIEIKAPMAYFAYIGIMPVRIFNNNVVDLATARYIGHLHPDTFGTYWVGGQLLVARFDKKNGWFNIELFQHSFTVNPALFAAICAWVAMLGEAAILALWPVNLPYFEQVIHNLSAPSFKWT